MSDRRGMVVFVVFAAGHLCALLPTSPPGAIGSGVIAFVTGFAARILLDRWADR